MSSDEHKMVAVRVLPDHRSDSYREFLIEPMFEKDVITVLDKFEKLKSNKVEDSDDEEEVTTCPHGYENCNEDDFESMCDECKTDRGEAHAEGMQDTYDF